MLALFILAEGRAMSTDQLSLASAATSRSGSEISVLGRGDSSGSMLDTVVVRPTTLFRANSTLAMPCLQEEDGKPKKTLRARAIGSLRKITGKKVGPDWWHCLVLTVYLTGMAWLQKSSTSLSAISAASSATELPVSRIANFTPPGPGVTGSAPKPGGDVLQLSGRSHYLIFLNGVYVELDMLFQGYPVYRTQ